MNPEVIGYIGTAISTISFVPQVIKVYRTKQTLDISYPAFILLGTGNIIWLIYGLMINSPSVILANAMVGLLVSLIILLKFHYERK